MVQTVHSDTIDLLRECNAGVKMGVISIEEVIDKVQNDGLKNLLNACKDEHQQLGSEIHELLNSYHDEGKEPNPMAKGMSWMKTNVMMSVKDEDSTIADLITDGCNMGVKSLNRYLNKYEAADEKTKDIAKRLINLEEKLTVDIRQYL
ncbi:MAG: hypothetical protein J1F63_05440 [Oscillospiraceae bacterium]|nr:hypothetical protein [Oscillospiraceae bacterium]